MRWSEIADGTLSVVRAEWPRAGLMRTAFGFLRDPLWWVAGMAGFTVAIGLRFAFPSAMAISALHGLEVWLSCVLWQPVLEEGVFRGLIQGELLRRRAAAARWLGISAANLITSVFFVALHFFHHPPLWALSVFVPSLLFGWFRERHRGVGAPMGLHILFNLGFFMAASRALG